MKVVFIYPGIACIGYNSYTTHLGEGESLPIYGIALLAGIIKARGHEVELLDLRQLVSEEDLIARLRASTAEAVAITVQTPSFNIASRVAEIAKWFGKKVLAGGIHATVAPEDFHHPWWDHVIKGDGEITLPDKLEGFDILPSSQIPETDLNCIVISTKVAEEAIYQKLKYMNLDRVEIVRLIA